MICYKIPKWDTCRHENTGQWETREVLKIMVKTIRWRYGVTSNSSVKPPVSSENGSSKQLNTNKSKGKICNKEANTFFKVVIFERKKPNCKYLHLEMELSNTITKAVCPCEPRNESWVCKKKNNKHKTHNIIIAISILIYNNRFSYFFWGSQNVREAVESALNKNIETQMLCAKLHS